MLRTRIPHISKTIIQAKQLYRINPHLNYAALLTNHPFSRYINVRSDSSSSTTTISDKLKQTAEEKLELAKKTFAEVEREMKSTAQEKMSNAKEKLSSAQDQLHELNSDIKTEASELKGELKEGIKQKMFEDKNKIKNDINAIDAALHQETIKADENIRDNAKPGHDFNWSSHGLNSSSNKNTNKTIKRGFATRGKEHAGDVKPGEMVESKATENRYIPTTSHPSANEETVEKFKYKQSVDSYERGDNNMGFNAKDLADEAKQTFSSLQNKAHSVLEEAKEKSYDMKDSLPTIDAQEIKESVKEKTANLAEKAKSTFVKAKDYTMGAIDNMKENLDEKLHVDEVSSKITKSKDSFKQKLGDAMNSTLTNTAAPNKDVTEELEYEAHYGAGRNIDDERLDDDSINPADINLSDSAYEHDHNINIDIQRPESIARGADTNISMPHLPHDSDNVNSSPIDSSNMKSSLAGEDLNEINDIANEERLQTGNKNLGSNTTSKTLNKDKYPQF